MLAQARACANGYALATEGIAVVSDFQNNECHIYSGRFGQTIMDFPEYMVDHTSAFENTVFSHANEEELIQRHILELRFFNFIKELPINEKTNFSASSNGFSCHEIYNNTVLFVMRTKVWRISA